MPFEQDVQRYLRQVAEGLQFMHQLNIAHLDIKVTFLYKNKQYRKYCIQKSKTDFDFQTNLFLFLYERIHHNEHHTHHP